VVTATAPGPIYDNALRLLARRDLVHVCHWLDLPTSETAIIHRAESLPAATHYVDLIAEIAPQHLAHVEFVRSPDPAMTHRMLEYRARVMALHPRHRLTQRVVVLAHGTVTPELLDPPQLTLRLNITYLRNEDPERLLANPSLAPLAVLAHAHDQDERAKLLLRSLAVIKTVTDPAHRHDLLHTAVTLAGIHLDAPTIEHLTLEAGMPFTLDEDTVAGRSLIARGEARGEARGLARGLARGEARERVRTLASLMRRTFGDDPRIEPLAQNLAALPHEQALDIALTAATLDDLTTMIDKHRAADPKP
jgi:predicted transposase YdaD